MFGHNLAPALRMYNVYFIMLDKSENFNINSINRENGDRSKDINDT